MHVAIKQTVLDKILKRISEIRRDNREPDYIVVSHEEYAELRGDRRMWRYVEPDMPSYKDARITPAQMTIQTREFSLRPGHVYDPARELPFIRTYSREKFMNLPLYVVPSEYMPA